ncbi:MAG: hypothetical protein ACFFC7_26605 [Candidatus Hermodarchaeota archaeon]
MEKKGRSKQTPDAKKDSDYCKSFERKIPNDQLYSILEAYKLDNDVGKKRTR